jgi:predicted N-acetyltransferase YhbS
MMPPMALDWTESTDALDWDELAALYRAAPLGQKTAADLRIAFTNSRHACLVREHGRLVGAGRALADGVDAAYLCDIAVLPSHQGSGLGQAIVQHLLQRVAGHKKILLYAVPGKEPFYARFGFRRMKTAMALFDNPEAAWQRGHLLDPP